MTRILRHSRGLMIALVVLALSAGAALAGRSMPQAAADGLAKAAEAAGKIVPVANGAPEAAPAADEDADTDAGATEDATTPDADAATHPDNHGADVSAAAKGDPPAELASQFDNHGAWVSSVARDNAGAAKKAAHQPVHPTKP